MADFFAVKVEIEGAKYIWASSAQLAASASDGRSILPGLQHEGLMIEQRADIKGGALEGNSLTLQIVAGTEADEEFSKSAKLVSYLSSSMSSTAATTMNVRSNALISDGDYLHIGTECVLVSDASTDAVVVARAKRGTEAQIHERYDGAKAAEVPVWSLPLAWEGRRVTVTVYESYTDSYTAYRGVITQAPFLNETGTAWLIGVDSIVSRLDQSIGRPQYTGSGIRGIKLGTSSAFGVSIGGVAQCSVVGFFAGESDMIDAIDTAVSAISYSGISAWSASIADSPDYGRHVAIDILIGGADLSVPLIVAGSTLLGSFEIGSRYHAVTSGAPAVVQSAITTLLANTTYRMAIYPRPAANTTMSQTAWLAQGDYATPFPAALIYMQPAYAPRYPFRNDTATADEQDNVIAVGDDLAIVSGDILTLEGPTFPTPLKITVVSDLGDNVYTFTPEADAVLQWCRANAQRGVIVDADTKITVAKSLGLGDFRALVTAITTSAPYANSGEFPYLTTADIDAPSQALIDAKALGIYDLVARDYNVGEDEEIAKVFAQECLIYRLMMRFTSAGKIGFVGFGVPSRTAPVVATFTASEIATPWGSGGMFPRWIPSTDGIVSEVSIISGSGAASAAFRRLDDVERQPVIYRDITSVSAHKNRGTATLEIEPYPITLGLFDAAEASIIASEIIAFFGQPYETIVLRVLRTASARAVLIGDVIGITSTHVPNTSTGRRGVSNRRAVVIGKRMSLDPKENGATIEFTAIVHSTQTSGTGGANNTAGYAPSLAVTNATNVSGNTWDLTITQNLFGPSGSDDVDFYEVGDYVNVWQFDDSTPNEQQGTVVSKTATNIRIAFGGVAPWGGSYSGTYFVEYDDSGVAGASDTQDDYAYQASADLLLVDGTIARIFA